MSHIFDNPFIVFAASMAAQYVAAYCGYLLHSRKRVIETVGQGDLDTIHAAALTLLGLIIGHLLHGRWAVRSTQELRGKRG